MRRYCAIIGVSCASAAMRPNVSRKIFPVETIFSKNFPPCVSLLKEGAREHGATLDMSCLLNSYGQSISPGAIFPHTPSNGRDIMKLELIFAVTLGLLANAIGQSTNA